MDDHVRIGHLNIIRGGDEVHLGRYAEIIRMNEINSIAEPEVVNPTDPRFLLGDGSIITAGHSSRHTVFEKATEGDLMRNHRRSMSYVAVVVSPTNAILYLYNTNGLLSATNAVAHNNTTWGGSRANIRIGCDNSVATTFNGKIDEVAVFKRTLTSAEIIQLTGVVNLQIAPVGGNLQLIWPYGTLLEAPDITGPWTTNLNTSPYVVAPIDAKKFYRIQIP